MAPVALDFLRSFFPSRTLSLSEIDHHVDLTLPFTESPWVGVFLPFPFPDVSPLLSGQRGFVPL